MRHVIFGFIILITGIVLCVIHYNEVPAELERDMLERPGLSYKKLLFPYLIPIGIIIATIGFGEIISKKKRKMRCRKHSRLISRELFLKGQRTFLLKRIKKHFFLDIYSFIKTRLIIMILSLFFLKK